MSYFTVVAADLTMITAAVLLAIKDAERIYNDHHRDYLDDDGHNLFGDD
jgi:hypothetical protein